MELRGFIGPFDTTRSRSFNMEDTINWYPERMNAGTPKTEWCLLPSPGLRVFAWFTGGTIRGLFQQDGRAWGVSGAYFGEIMGSGGPVAYESLVLTDGQPVSMASNGTGGDQLILISGGLGYIFDLTLNTLTEITDEHFPANATQVVYMDGYFIVLRGGTRTFQISELEDGLLWDGLDVFERSEGSDNFQCMVQNHREIWFFGTKTTEVWVDTGDANTPFAPIPGVFIEQGCVAPWSALRCDNTIFWIGMGEQGQGVVYAAQGYTPQRVSTFAVEDFLAQSGDLTVAKAFSYLWRGHYWYGLYIPDLPQTLMYDLATQSWFKIAGWNVATSRWTPHRTNSAMAPFNNVLVGDHSSRGVYYVDDTAYQNILVVS